MFITHIHFIKITMPIHGPCMNGYFACPPHVQRSELLPVYPCTGIHGWVGTLLAPLCQSNYSTCIYGCQSYYTYPQTIHVCHSRSEYLWYPWIERGKQDVMAMELCVLSGGALTVAGTSLDVRLAAHKLSELMGSHLGGRQL